MNLKNIFRKNKNQKEGVAGKSFKGWFHRIIIFLENNSWVFTVVFLGTVFVVSLWVWWNCIYSPKPSEKILKEVSASQKSLKQLISEIEKGIEALEDCKSRSAECKTAVLGKEIFATKEEAEWIFEKEKTRHFLDEEAQTEEKIDGQNGAGGAGNEIQPEINQAENNEDQSGSQETLVPGEDVMPEGSNNPVVMP